MAKALKKTIIRNIANAAGKANCSRCANAKSAAVINMYSAGTKENNRAEI